MSEFAGNWNDVCKDGYWDGWTKEQHDEAADGGLWTYLSNYDELPHPDYYGKLNADLREHGLIMVYFWDGGDPGMGGHQRLFKLPEQELKA